MERREQKGTNRVTTQQLSRMASALETAPEIANNGVRGPQTVFWRKVAKELNELGPVVRDTTSWKRVWFDYKFSVKKRVKQHNEDIEDGVYPRQLSPIQARVAKLLNMEVKKSKLIQATCSSSEDMHSDETTGFKDETFDPEDSNPLSSMMRDASDDTMNPLATRSLPRAINACHKRLEKLPNITIVKQKHDRDPLANGAAANSTVADEESNAVPSFSTSRKRARDANFHKALETNKAMIAVVNASLIANKELTAEMRAMSKSCNELNENMKNMNSTMRELIEVLKNK
ncbi:uncharacterized protein LOC128712915 [Anopheles marshallii]|uniref:uncharacterized protein LOC128712915 n=1 Tax=Anopheles marshallii TaxID=1521116 RepID=UPI00237A9948|nr:uncharacterized protein LOC128712915 [Anopheles marshallii]